MFVARAQISAREPLLTDFSACSKATAPPRAPGIRCSLLQHWYSYLEIVTSLALFSTCVSSSCCMFFFFFCPFLWQRGNKQRHHQDWMVFGASSRGSLAPPDPVSATSFHGSETYPKSLIRQPFSRKHLIPIQATSYELRATSSPLSLHPTRKEKKKREEKTPPPTLSLLGPAMLGARPSRRAYASHWIVALFRVA